MLECRIKQRLAFCAAEIECKINSELSNHQWQLAEKVVKILKSFEEATVVVRNEGLTAALVVPIVIFLVHFQLLMTMKAFRP